MKNRIWKWPDDDFRVYCERNEDYRKIMSWKGARYSSIYSFPNGSVRYDVIVPRNLHNRVAELLGLPNRVRARAKRQETPLQVVVTQGGSKPEIAAERRLIDCDRVRKGPESHHSHPITHKRLAPLGLRW